jgi:hypothetical protein
VGLKNVLLFIGSLLMVYQAGAQSSVESSLSACQNEVKIKSLSSILNKTNATCLDSVQKKFSERSIFFAEDSRSRLFIVDTILKQGKPQKNVIVTEIKNPDLFPKGCGSYLMGARILPGSQKVALLYKASVVRIVDIKSSQVVDLFDVRDPGMAYTCELYRPNKEALRDQVSLSVVQKQIHIEYYDYSKKELTCSSDELTASQIKNINDDLSFLVSLMEDYQARQNPVYTEHIKNLEQEIKAYRLSLENNKRCWYKTLTSVHTMNY